MKTIVITGNDGQIAGALGKAVANYQEDLDLALSMEYGEEMLENISFAQPDFIITDNLSEKEVDAILDRCIDVTIVFITSDLNRTQATVANFNKQGKYNFIVLEKEKITPNKVLEMLISYNNDSLIDEDELMDTKQEESKEEEISLDDLPQIEKNEDTPRNEEMKVNEDEISEDFKEELKGTSISDFKPVEVETPKVVSNLGKLNSATLDSVSSCQVVTVYSKKGGTGKTTIAKEIANVFSNVTLPKKISNKDSMDVCLIDTNFEQGDIRTILGIQTPQPNLYHLIDDVISKMESGVPLQNVYFSEPEIKTNYCISVPGSHFKVICLGQGEIPKKLIDRIAAFNDDELIIKILRRIIKLLKEAFNILVIDTSSSFTDITEMIFKMSTKIVYVLEENLTSLDNLKTLLENTKENCYVTNKIIPILNKSMKTPFMESFDMIYKEIIKNNENLTENVCNAPFDIEVVKYNNDYAFMTNTQNRFKQGIIQVCSQILPIFKVQNISSDLKLIEQRKKMEAKRKKELEKKEATERLKKDIKNRKGPVEVKEEAKTETQETPKENLITEVGDLTYLGYLRGDLTKVATADEFVRILSSIPDAKLSKKGFPIVSTKPKTLNKKVWKAYYKMLVKSLK